MLGRITIIGRPNVGKSSLFNLITGHKIAIVSDTENTTRDILEYQVNDEENDISYIIADSGGLTEGSSDEILKDTRIRAEESIEKSDIILFVLEFDKITTLDEQIVKILRKTKKEVIVVGNKLDNESKINDGYDLYSLGFKKLFFTSTAHNRGITNLKSEIIKKLKELGFDYKEKKYDESWIKIAIIGKPNVGKSSIVNAITGENRVMVKDIAGTTRDAVDSLFEWNNQKFVIIDTAGIRRSGKIGSKNIEKWSLLRSERAIERADIIAVVIDGFDGITAGDQHIIQKALEANKGIILVINKWDKVLNIPGTDKEKAIDKYIYHLRNKLEFLPYVTPIFTIAIEGKRLNDILETAIKIKEERKKRIQTSVFNDFLSQIVFKHAPTGTRKSHKPKIFYGSQVDINPPKFLISVNNSDHFHFSYKRYIENKIREFFGFWGTPIIIELKGRESIYKKKLVKFKNVDHRFKKDNSSK